MALPQYLPSVAIMMTEFQDLVKKFKSKVNFDASINVQNETNEQNIVDDIKDIKFQLNNLGSEVLIVKKIARPESLTQIQKNKEKIKYIEG